VEKIKKIEEYLFIKRAFYNGKGICWCGNFQTHNKQICHDCGQPFKIFKDPLSLFDLIKMKQRSWGEVPGLGWYYAIYQRSMSNELKFKVTKDLFVEAFNILKESEN
jgi:hypothetical protein